MTQLTIKQRLCQLLSENERLSLVMAGLLGLVGIGLLVGNLQAGESVTEQAWFLAFLIAYVVGVRPLVASVRRE